MRKILSAAIATALLSSCVAGEGRFSIQFKWAGGSPPANLPGDLYARIAVYQGDLTSVPIAGAGPNSFEPTAPLPMQIPSLKNGSNYFVKAEIVNSKTATAQVLYYGVSSAFDIEPGKTTNATVSLQSVPSPKPGAAPSTGGNVQLQTSGSRPGLTNSTTVGLVLITDTGVSVNVSNVSGFPAASTKTFALTAAEATTLVSVAAPLHAYLVPGWSLGTAGSFNCDVPSGCPETVYAQFIDVNGELSSVATGSIVLDQQNPGVAFASVTYLASPTGVVPSISLGGTGATIVVSVSADETIDTTQPVGMTATSPSGMTLQFTLEGSARSDGATFQAVVQTMTPPIDVTVFTPAITWTDLAGNKAMATPFSPSPAIQVKTTAPGAPDTLTVGQVTYSRIPWGNTETSGIQKYTVAGNVAAFAENGTAVVFDGTDTASASVLGQGPIDLTADGGGFTVELARVDHPAVYIAEADSAGNVSSTAVAVHDTNWTATFGGKMPQNPVPNPHVALTTQNFHLQNQPPLPWGSLEPDSADTAEATDYAGLLSPNGAGLTTIGSAIWRQPGGISPQPRGFFAQDYDSARAATVVFGGYADDGANLGDTWVWNGGQWANLSPALPTPSNSPAPRFGHIMAYDSRRAVSVLFGGYTTTSLNDTWEWNGTAWTQVVPASADLPIERCCGAMSYDSTHGATVMFGGQAQNSSALNDTWLWDGTSWTNVTPAAQVSSVATCLNETTYPAARSDHAMSFDSKRNVTVLFGGSDGQTNNCGDTFVFDGAAWTNKTPAVITATNSPVARYWQGQSFDPVRGVTLLTGGSNSYSTSGGVLNDAWTWDGTNWTNITPAAITKTNFPSPRFVQNQSFDAARGVTLEFGGNNSSYGGLDTLWQWDGTAWTNVTPLMLDSKNSPSPARSNAAMAFDAATRETVLFGGEYPSASGDGAQLLLSDTWGWTGTAWLNLLPAAAPPPRFGHTLTYDSLNKNLVLMGGCVTTGTAQDTSVCAAAANDTWTWAGTAWTNVTPAAGSLMPSARVSHAAVFDAARGVTVVYGGESITSGGSCTTADGTATAAFVCGDVWEWNGTAWSNPIPSGTAPVPRQGEAMAYDSVRQTTVMFGGETGTMSAYCNTDNLYLGNPGGYLCDDTWTWDGTAWTDHSPSIATSASVADVLYPQARYDFALIYDSTRAVTVMFGGDITTTYGLGDTWWWDGTAWTPASLPAQELNSTNSPTLRSGHSLAYDQDRAEAVLFGGDGTFDTWIAPSAAGFLPAQIDEMSFAAAGEPSANIRSATFTASATGQGNTLALSPDGGAPVAGAGLAVWDVQGGTWREVASNAADGGTSSALTYTSKSSSEAMRYLSDPTGQRSIGFAEYPATPNGNGPSPASIAVSYVQLDVNYVHAEDPADCNPNTEMWQCPDSAEAVCPPAVFCEGDGGTAHAVCSYLKDDANNCGTCGVACAIGQLCTAGMCQPCPSQQTACFGRCVDMTIDPNNCGACGNLCGDGKCEASICQ